MRKLKNTPKNNTFPSSYKKEGIVVSKNGYKRDSPDKDNPVLSIPSNHITMKDVDFPVYGIGSDGSKKVMYPDQDYYFPNAHNVTEFPLMQVGGPMPVINDMQYGMPMPFIQPDFPINQAISIKKKGLQDMFTPQQIKDAQMGIRPLNTRVLRDYTKSQQSQQIPSFAKGGEISDDKIDEQNKKYFIEQVQKIGIEAAIKEYQKHFGMKKRKYSISKK